MPRSARNRLRTYMEMSEVVPPPTFESNFTLTPRKGPATITILVERYGTGPMIQCMH